MLSMSTTPTFVMGIALLLLLLLLLGGVLAIMIGAGAGAGGGISSRHRHRDDDSAGAAAFAFFAVDAFHLHTNTMNKSRLIFGQSIRFQNPSPSLLSLSSSLQPPLEGINSKSNINSIITPPLISPEQIRTIQRGGVTILPNWLPPHLITSMKQDAQLLFASGYFQPDGLTNTAIKSRDMQNFTVKADRQTFRGKAGWYDESVGNVTARLEFANRMDQLRKELAVGLDRPTLYKIEEHDVVMNDGDGIGNDIATRQRQRHEITYNWYEPGAKLGRHLDEHHEEMKGTKGWVLPTRRSVTWLVYLNDHWEEEEGGALRCFPRSEAEMQSNGEVAQVGAHDGNLQVGWVNGGADPVFLDCFRPSGMAALYKLVLQPVEEGTKDNVDRAGEPMDEPAMRRERRILSIEDFDVPSMQPIEFASFLLPEIRDTFTQISTSRLDPRFAGSSSSSEATNFDCSDEKTILDIMPAGGTLVLFDSVSLPHLVREVTGTRQRIAATGWFHEDSQFVLEV